MGFLERFLGGGEPGPEMGPQDQGPEMVSVPLTPEKGPSPVTVDGALDRMETGDWGGENIDDDDEGSDDNDQDKKPTIH